MDRELLSKMLSELIVDHDVVGLPGLGSFVAELVPASFSDKGFTINPPYRRLSFKPNCTEDQLLVEFYSRINNVPIDLAREYIFQFLAGFCDVLKDKKNITLPGLGRLRATKENNFFFVPDEDLDIFPETFALKAVSLKSHPLIEEKVEIPFSFQPKSVPIELEAFVDPEMVDIVSDEEIAAPAVRNDDPINEEPTVIASDNEAIPANIENEEIPVVTSDEEIATLAPLVRNEEPTNEEIVPQKKRFKWWIILIVLVSIGSIALAAFLILANVAPDFIDSILYTSEELWIINY